MKHFHHLTAALLALALGVSCSSVDEPELIGRLDDVLYDKEVYIGHFLEKTSIIKDVLSEETNPEQIYSMQMRLADCYRSYCLDSVISYLTLARGTARQLGCAAREARADFGMAVAYVKAGYSTEANDILAKYRGIPLPDGIREDYWAAEHKYWGETMAYTSDKTTFDDKLAQRDNFRNLLLGIVPEHTWEWYNLKREEADAASDVANVRHYASQMLRVSPENSHEWAEAAYFYAHSFEYEDRQTFETYLIRSAIADIMCATKDYASLNDVSRLLFDRGDIDRAFRYAADHCMADALSFNGKLRPWQISRFFPEIELAYQQKIARHNRITMWLLCGSLVLFALLLLLFAFLVKRQRVLDSTKAQLQASYQEIDRRNHELEAINERLLCLNAKIQEADKVKQEYITQFLAILSENITSGRQYKNKVLKYIRQGNTKALCEEIEQLPTLDDDILEFYKMFDQTFVNIYPDFVRKFNELLVDGAAIVPKGDDILTPELRIFALIKLGIYDSSSIASLLHYSANTIYNYRSKIKSKARGSRDSFEEAVCNIE